jgi:sugar phosphate permease
MMSWGVMTMLLGVIHSFASLVIVRFFLGAFEAGLFPGMIYCLTFWYKQDERALRAALISTSAALGTLIPLISLQCYSNPS